MLDVGHVAVVLLTKGKSPRWGKLLADSLGVEKDLLNAWVPFLLALHDIGKISASFQSISEGQRARLIHED